MSVSALAQRCRDAVAALEAAQRTDPEDERVDYLADDLVSARVALYEASRREATVAAYEELTGIAAGVADPLGASRPGCDCGDAALVSRLRENQAAITVRLATGLLMQRHGLDRTCTTQILVNVCERFGVSTLSVAERVVRAAGLAA